MSPGPLTFLEANGFIRLPASRCDMAGAPGESHVRIATYTRISTDEDRQPFSLEAQSVRLDSYIVSQPAWEKVRSFTDQGSGVSVERPPLQRALTEARAGRSICCLWTALTGWLDPCVGLRTSSRSWTTPRWPSARPPSPSTPARPRAA